MNGDDIFEPDEFIEATLDYDLFLPKPFKPKHINDSSGYNSVVDPPPTGSVTVANKSALIVIKEGNIMHTHLIANFNWSLIT